MPRIRVNLPSTLTLTFAMFSTFILVISVMPAFSHFSLIVSIRDLYASSVNSIIVPIYEFLTETPMIFAAPIGIFSVIPNTLYSSLRIV